MFARLVSQITDPALVFILGVIVLLVNAGAEDFSRGFVFVFVPTLLVGTAAAIEYFRARSSEVTFNRYQRNGIVLAAAFAFGLNTVIFGSQIFPSVFWFSLSMLFTIAAVSLYLVNHYFDKASIHVLMISVWTFILIDQRGTGWFLLFPLIVLTAWSRFKLKKHTGSQLLWGFFLASLVGLLSWVAL
ncbi:MAG: hypothetical protein JNK26_04210 [Candidatus Doudnabacteria bacterium]|nr:hypothetical protein [Candidatus Doudnabacteria bacterium]